MLVWDLVVCEMRSAVSRPLVCQGIFEYLVLRDETSEARANKDILESVLYVNSQAKSA